MKELAGLLRTHTCGELREEHIGQRVTLAGWINKIRDLGGLYFIDVRDKFGLVQLGLVEFKGDLELLKKLSLETVIKVAGVVRARPAAAINKQLPTGAIEVQIETLEILSHSKTVPFLPLGANPVNESLRLKYRYLDLRRPRLQEILKTRSETANKIRKALIEEGFVEVETPVLYKSTPEGARDYVVPSRVHPGTVYALPQSPQTLKQLLMIGGLDRYFQVTKCFRDEDLRADRQPEFTQIDIEVSFLTQDYIRHLNEKLIKMVFGMPADFKLPLMSYTKAMELYGCDKPDTRFSLKHLNVTACFEKASFDAFRTIHDGQGLIKAIFLPEKIGTLARKDIDGLVEIVRPFGGKGVAWFKVSAEGRTGGISKFIDDALYAKLSMISKTAGEGEGNGLWFFFGDTNPDLAHACADAVRRHFGKMFNLLADGYSFLWVYDFPLLEFNAEDKRFYAKHHPFTQPHHEDMSLFMSGKHEDLLNCRAEAYDLICNGTELGGGSLRIYDNEVQSQMFKLLGMNEEETTRQFGFFIEALSYGTPPHGGIAWGFDRLMMILCKTENLTDVIAFPKTMKATDLMAGSPSVPSEAQIKELHFNWDIKK